MYRYIFMLAALLVLHSPVVRAAETPSNAQLFEMMKAMQAKLESLESENRQLKKSLSVVETAAPKSGAFGELRKEFDTKIEAAKAEVVAATTRTDPPVPAPRDKGDWAFSAGSTAYFVFGDALTYVRSGSGAAGVNGNKESSKTINHQLAPSIDLAALHNVPASAWSVGGDLSYLHVETTEQDIATTANTTMPAFGLASNVSGTNKSFVGESKLTRVVGGVNLGYDFVHEQDARFGLDVGLRAGGLSHKMRIQAGTGETFDNGMRFAGGGPRFGLSGRYELGNGFGIAGGAGGAFLVGYGDIDQAQSAGNERTDEDGMRLVPVFDTRIAGTYAAKVGSVGLGIELGLKAEHWTNLPAWYMPTHSTAVNPAKSDADSMSFVGPYLEIKGTF